MVLELCCRTADLVWLSGGCLTPTHSSMTHLTILDDGALIAAVPLELIAGSWWPCWRSCWSFSCFPAGVVLERPASPLRQVLPSPQLVLIFLCLGMALTSRALGKCSPYSILSLNVVL
ncbi:LOW QUALITY PROTEIN: hypothetical protein Nmel_003718 [Mimus melanotis]